MSSSSSSFGRLLQSTRISTWDPTIPQLYTAPPSFAVRGQYGFKRPIPLPQASSSSPRGQDPSSSSSGGGPPLATLIRQRNIDLVCPDTPAGIAIWAIDASHPRFLKTFEEKGVKLLDYDPAHRKLAKDSARPPPVIEPSTVFDASTRRILPTEVDPADERTQRLARIGFARPGGRSAQRSPFDKRYSYSGFTLSSDTNAPIDYTSLDIVPNYQRMTEKQFEAYLDHIRTKVRPALVRHLAGMDRANVAQSAATAKAAASARQAEDRKLAAQAQAAKEDGVETETADAHAEIAAAREPGTIPVPTSQTGAQIQVAAADEDDIIVDMWDASRALPTSYTTTFLRSKLANKVIEPTSKTLPSGGGKLVPDGDLPPLHPNGGLQYGGPDEIFTSRLNRPAGLPAHVLHRVEDPTAAKNPAFRRLIFSSSGYSTRGGAAVSYGGHVAHIPGPVLPRQVNLEQMYQAADAVASAPSHSNKEKSHLEDLSRHPTHMLVRPIQAFQARISTVDRARQWGITPAVAPTTGVSRTAALAASAAGRPIGSAREHIVPPDPTSIHVRVRPVYIDELYAEDSPRPLSLDPKLSTPGTPEYVGLVPEPLSREADLPGIERLAPVHQPAWTSRRLTQAQLYNSVRNPEMTNKMTSDIVSLFADVGNVGASAARRAAGGTAAGAGPDGGDARIPRSRVGPAARPKHHSNIKK
ncbi:hypothetical protein V8E36_007829 [Tilletia maclaganii]